MDGPALEARRRWRQAWQAWLAASQDLLEITARQAPRFSTLGSTLFVLGSGIYLFTRLFHLADYPIYFFGDEAAQVLFAERLIASGFKDAHGIWFPVYFEEAASRWTPLVSVYFQAAALSLFGKSVFITRATSALVSLLAGASISLALKQAFKVRFWWAGMLLLAVTPAYFLHARTAFETAMTTAFYGGFLLCYLLYRLKSPRWLYATMLLGALTFYSYSNAQVIMAASAGLLFLSDLRYHLRQTRRTWLAAALLLLLLAVPFLAFRLEAPEGVGEHLRMVNSYWVQPISLTEKLGIFAQKYAYGLSPQYWFFPNEHDLVRHRMARLGQIQTWVLPLFLLGVVIAVSRLRQAEYRAVLLAGLAAPAGAALLEIGITRVLAFIIPANILAGLGLDWLLQRLQAWFLKKSSGRWSQYLLDWGIFAGLATAALLLLRTALTQGPLWFRDYSLYGMQYGARQIFEDAIPDVLRRNPATLVLVTSTWANGTDNFLGFFLDKEQRQRVRMDGIDSFLFSQRQLNQDMLFIMTPLEYAKAIGSPKIKQVTNEGFIPYPDGTPGFYLARLEYADNVEEIFAAEKEARRQLVEGQVTVDGEIVSIRYSQIDMGGPELMFDGDHFTLMRGLEANPFILELAFLHPRPVSGLEADFGLMDVGLTVTLYPAGGGEPHNYSLTRRQVTDPMVKMPFDDPPAQVLGMRISIFNPLVGETANIHIRELRILP